jgi:MFS family permease
MKEKSQQKWLALAILSAAQFIMILDGTVMNVSISQVVVDLGTTVSGMQAAITFFTLTMAAFMLTGSKLGNKWGALPAFTIGLMIYGVGSFVTGSSQSLAVLMLGWSFIEGLGAVLVIPAIVALIASNYQGHDRIVSFSVIGAVSGIAAALGPLIGGIMTTYFSWRYVFFGETVLVILLLLLIKKLASEKTKNDVTLDPKSVLLSAFGMGLLVLGILQGKTWGWISPLKVPEVFGYEIALFGISLVAYLIFFGIIFLMLFFQRQALLIQNKQEPFLDILLFQIPVLRAGLAILFFQSLSVAAIFFVIPVYLQVILGYDALRTGIKILPLSLGIVIFAIIGTKLLNFISVRSIVRYGQAGLVFGTLIILLSLDLQFRPVLFELGMFMVGIGLGLLSSQIGNINMSAVPETQADEVGGLQGTFQNLGSSLGTAVIGSVLIISLTTSFVTTINTSSKLPDEMKVYINEHSSGALPIVSADEVENYAIAQGTTEEEAEEISTVYTDAQIEGLKKALFLLVCLSIFAIVLSKNIPDQKVIKQL